MATTPRSTPCSVSISPMRSEILPERHVGSSFGGRRESSRRLNRSDVYPGIRTMARLNGLNGKDVFAPGVPVNISASVGARMLIAGQWVNRGKMSPVFNPARPDELVGTIPFGTPDD